MRTVHKLGLAMAAARNFNPSILFPANDGDFFNITQANKSQFWTGFSPDLAVVNLGDPVRVALSPRCLTAPLVAHLNGSTGTVITTPYDAAYQLTGRRKEVVIFRFNNLANATNQGLGGRWQVASNQRSWRPAIGPTGIPTYFTSTLGSDTVTTAVTTAINTVASPGDLLALEYVFTPDNGSSQRTLVVRYAILANPDIDPADINWLAFDSFTGAATTVFAGTASGLSFGATFDAVSPIVGRGSRYLLYDATDTLIADCDPSQYTTGSSFDSGGVTWTLAGQALITGDADVFITPTDVARFPYARVPDGQQLRNLLIATDTLSTQNATVTAVQHTLSFKGTGTVTLSGVSTAGPLVGTGAADRVSLDFTPTAGTLTLTVSGSVLEGQLEVSA